MSNRFQFGMHPVQAIAALNELADDIAQAVEGAGNAASVIAVTPAGGIQSSNVQAALAELDTEKAPKASPEFTGVVRTTENGIVVEMGADINGAYVEARGGNPLRLYTNSAERVRVDTSGNLLIGSDNVDGLDGIKGIKICNASPGVLLDSPGVRQWLQYITPDGSLRIWDSTANLDRVAVDVSGNLLVGVTSGSNHRLYKNVNSDGTTLLEVGDSGASQAAFYVRTANTIGENGALSAVGVRKNGTTSRSINAAGTINASGADYAEYMTKAPGCGTLAKGQIVGVNADGQLVDTWADAVGFLPKSTDPSYVGGDTWGSEAVLGRARPVEPEFAPPEYTGAPPLGEDADGASLLAYEAERTAHAQLVAAARAAFDTITMPGYQAELAEFEALLEQARERVDRMAFCGQVPVNVTGALPGQYIVPVPDGDGIKGIAKNEAEMTLAEYMRSVGKVIAIEPDGRARIIVKAA